jgi:hypothetical protein
MGKFPETLRQYLSKTGIKLTKDSNPSIIDLLILIQSGVSLDTLFPSNSSGTWLRQGMPWTWHCCMVTDSKAPGSKSFSELGWKHSFSHDQFTEGPYSPLGASLSPHRNTQADLEAISLLDGSKTPFEYLARSDKDDSELYISAKIFVDDYHRRPSAYALPL